MEIQIGWIGNLMPIWSFILVFAVIYALLSKTKALGENKFIHLVVSLAISLLFLVSTKASKYLQLTMPWVVVFIICLVFIVLFVGVILSGKTFEGFFKPGFGWFLVALLIFFFLYSAVRLFGPITKYIPEAILQPQVYSIVIFCIITAIVAWVLVKK
ncbi:hypothetical protein B6U82_00430 [Candidatus Pacearchaeota archaeon ex4484_31]|nr:MAG: hypothetical protein B6U82_00430 [Candidatus Pacearchaeota archaeon ex4484_31]